MYLITYKHRLKSGKNSQDFKIWLDTHWTEQQSWGAEHVRYWRDPVQENNILFCEYRVDNIRHWTDAAMAASSKKIIRDLETIAEIKHIRIARDNGAAHSNRSGKKRVA